MGVAVAIMVDLAVLDTVWLRVSGGAARGSATAAASGRASGR